MSLNLAGIQKTVEGFMDDTVRIYRPLARYFNEDTGLYTIPEHTVYQGKCFMGVMGSPSMTNRGADQPARVLYEIGVPIVTATEDIQPEDIVEVITSLREPAMVGKIMRVNGVMTGTFIVHRRISATMDDSKHED